MNTRALKYWSGCFLGLLLGGSLLQADPNSINFADKRSGYQDGSLKGQNGFAIFAQAPGNGDFVYASGTGVMLKENRTSAQLYAYLFATGTDTPEGRDTFEPGLAQSISVNFILTQNTATGKKSVLGLGWGLYVPVGPNNLPFHLALLRDTAAGGYKLQIIKDEKTQVAGDPFLVIPESALGLDRDKGKTTSDPLQLSLTLNNEGDKSEWSTVGQLTNLKTHAVFDLKNTMTKAGYYKIDHLIRTVINPRRMDDDGLASVVITQLDPDVTPTPPTQ